MFYLFSISALLVNCISRWVLGSQDLPLADAIKNGVLFEKAQSASIFIGWIAILFYDKKNNTQKNLLFTIIAMTGNNFYDEVFGGPYTFNFEEKVFGIGIIVIWAAWAISKKWIKAAQP